MRPCTKCHNNLPDTMFSHPSICKMCFKDYGRTKEGFVGQMYVAQKTRSRRDNRVAPAYSSKDLFDWLMAKGEFHHLFHLWEVSHYDKWLKPSIDRLDPSLPYNFSNIELVTWKENHGRETKAKMLGVIQLTKCGQVVAEYDSISEATRVTGINTSNIARCCKGMRNSAGGYNWTY